MLLRSVSLMSSMMLVGFLTLIFSAPMYAKTIAFLVDNRHIDDRFRFTQRLESEIQAVINPQYTVNFRRYYGDAQHSIRQHMQTLYADATVDAVVVIGPLASNEVIQLRRVNIPTIVTGVIDRRVQPVPKTSSPGSGRTNIYYLNRHHDVEAEIDMLRSLTPFSHIAVLVSPSLLQAIPVLANFNIRQSNYRISVHAVTRDFEDDFAQWPDDVDAVYFAPHFEWSRAEITALASFLRAQRLPAFSYLEADLECGFLATEGNDKNDERFFRHIALNVERVVSGTAVELLPIAFDQRMQMTINMETARQLGISPSWSLLTDARRIHDLSDSIPRINIHRVALSARESSLSVKAGQAGVAAAEHDVGRAQAALYPQLTAVVSSVGIDEDRANASFGQQAEYSTRGQLTLSQNIYSETSRAARDIARHQYHQQASGQTQTELDAIYEAVGYFITVLQSQALESIREKNHQLTRQNVELAETRQRLGATGPSDLYRWQSQLAADEQDLTVARARLQQSKITLRHRLHQALTADFVAVEPPFKTVSLLLSHSEYTTLIRSPSDFERLIQYEVEQTLRHAPELVQIDAALAAQERALQSARRSYWAPNVAVQSTVTRYFSESGAGRDFDLSFLGLDGDGVDDLEWRVTLSASLPLYAGGARRATVGKARAELKRLRYQKQDLNSALEAQMRNAMYQAWSSFTTIDLARQAAVSAEKNYRLVKDAYTQGAADITALIDAQQTVLNADLGAANARYQFLRDLMTVQRISGFFEFLLSEEEQTAWLTGLHATFSEFNK